MNFKRKLPTPKEIKELYHKEKSVGGKPYIMCSDYVAEALIGYDLLLLGSGEREIASNLYEKLLEGEKIATLIIAVEMPNESGAYMGIMNRLRKSCG